MKLKCKIKFGARLVSFFLATTAYSQAPTPTILPTLFDTLLLMETGHNYQANKVYPTAASDNYWTILKSEGNTLITPTVGRVNNSWYDPHAQLLDTTLNWIHADGQGPGTYYYRFNFCIISYLVLDDGEVTVPKLFGGEISGNTTVKRIWLDGKVLIDFKDSAACPGQTRAQDYVCIRRFLYNNVPISQLGLGHHTVEFEIESSGDITGVMIGAVLYGINGVIIPQGLGFDYERALSGEIHCAPEGQIRGVVYDDLNANDIRDANEPIIPDVLVQLTNANGDLLQQTHTDANGAYNFYGIQIFSGLNFDNTPVYTVTSFLKAPYTPDKYTISPIHHYVSFSSGTNYIEANNDFGFKKFDTEICTGCIPSFLPLPNKRYLLSAWVKETYGDDYPDMYVNSGIKISFNNGAVQFPVMKATGPIIDRWQRIEADFTTPSVVNDMSIKLVNDNAAGDVFFDDVRIHPFKSNMKSFVYNPATQKVEAILDENNFSTRYEYDDEGILVRVKKETERGVQTIKETRNNQSKIKAQ